MSQVYTAETAERLTAAGDRFRDRLNAAGRRSGLPVQVTGIGSLMTVHFQKEPIERPADTLKTPPALRALFHLEMLTRGFYLARRGAVSLSLPLTEDDLEAFAAAFESFLDEHGSLLS